MASTPVVRATAFAARSVPLLQGHADADESHEHGSAALEYEEL